MPMNMFGQDDDENQMAMNGMTSISPVDGQGPSSMPQPPPAAPQTGPVASGAPPPMNPQVKDAVMQKFNLGPYSDEARQKLVDENNKFDLGGALERGISGFGAAFQGKDSNAASNAVAERLNNQKKAQLAQFDQARANKIQDYTLGQQMTRDERENERADPNSKPSQFLQGVVKKLYGDSIPADQLKNLSTDHADLILKPLELKAKLDEMAAKREDMRLSRKAAMTDKEKAEYDKYVQHAEQQASSLRGDDAAKLSSAKLSAIASGRALLKQYEGREDEMTNDQLALLAADRVKAVTGGVPTNDEIKHMMPSNMGTMGASTKGFFTNKPEPAHSGSWVKEANGDFDVQEKAARNILQNRQKQITSNPKLRPEDRDRIAKMAVPPELYNQQDGPTNSMASGGKVRMVAPNGSVKMVPAESVKEAIAAGGKVIDGTMVGGN